MKQTIHAIHANNTCNGRAFLQPHLWKHARSPRWSPTEHLGVPAQDNDQNRDKEKASRKGKHGKRSKSKKRGKSRAKSPFASSGSDSGSGSDSDGGGGGGKAKATSKPKANAGGLQAELAMARHAARCARELLLRYPDQRKDLRQVIIS